MLLIIFVCMIMHNVYNNRNGKVFNARTLLKKIVSNRLILLCVTYVIKH